MANNDRKKLNGSGRTMYVWKDRDEHASYRRRSNYEPAEKAKDEVPPAILGAVACVFAIVVVFVFMFLISNGQLDSDIAAMSKANVEVSETISCEQDNLNKLMSKDMIEQEAKELGMTVSGEDTTKMVSVPNRSGSTLTANAGGN